MSEQLGISQEDYMSPKQSLAEDVDGLLTAFGTVGGKPVKGLIHAQVTDDVTDGGCVSRPEVSWAPAGSVSLKEARRFGEALVATVTLIEGRRELVDGETVG